MPKRRSGQATQPVAPTRPIVNTEQSQTETNTAAPATAQPLEISTPAPSSKPAVPIIFPAWPTSRPGPWVTPPPPGMRSVNTLRPEQVTEVGYNQETGEPEESVRTDVTQDVVRKRQKKERL